MKGKIKFYNRSKDFGFIAAENGEEYYFNAASMQLAQDNAPVEFQTQKTARGEVAKQVMLVGSSSASSTASKPACKGKMIGGIVVAIVLIVAAFFVGHYS